MSLKDFGDSQPCEVNVHCPEGDPWSDEIRSVALIIGSFGTRICNGVLVNNVRADFTPYLLTADYCIKDIHGNYDPSLPNSWIFVFNYESPTCVSVDGPLNQTTTGATLLAHDSLRDFSLVQLNEPPPDTYNVYYAGWSTLLVTPATGTCIHHPRGDVKKISLDYDSLTSSDFFDSTGFTHWRVGSWDIGTTEIGTYGAPLFDQNHLIVGLYAGGSASCTNPSPDWFGKFYQSMYAGTSSANRLADWLDPDTTGTLQLSGLDKSGLSLSVDADSGWVPLTVNFSADPGRFTADSWIWDFGDGNSANSQFTSHTYTDPGAHAVTVQFTSDTTVFSRSLDRYIKVFADTLTVGSMPGEVNGETIVPVYGINNFSLATIIIPIEYSGPAYLTLDSFSTVGCRTDFFTLLDYANYDPFNSRVAIRLRNSSDGSVAELSPGSGLLAKLYFRIASNAVPGQFNPVVVDGYLGNAPTFKGSIAAYQPAIIDGGIVIPNCCVGIRGNVDGDAGNSIDIADVIYLVDYSFGSGPAPACAEEADVNADGGIDVTDLIYLVDYSFGSGPAPLACP